MIIDILLNSAAYSQLAINNGTFVGKAIVSGFHIPTSFLKYWNRATPGSGPRILTITVFKSIIRMH
jgi:hypothetical protein